MWGLRDHHTKETYGKNVLGARDAIPKILELFRKYDIRATWATVGFLFCETKEELLNFSPEIRPTYENRSLSNYEYFNEVGENEKLDPYYFGASLLKVISSYPGQEISSHSFSHYYCGEPGQTVEQFDADMAAAVAVAKHRGLELQSFVFPRNQFSVRHLDVLIKHGIYSFRGNEVNWLSSLKETNPFSTIFKRMARLTDSYFDLSGSNSFEPSPISNAVNVPASRFLRPYSNRLSALEGLKLARILNSMTIAAKSQRCFHIWWHPHNFGARTGLNIFILEQILEHFTFLRSTLNWQSRNMADFL